MSATLSNLVFMVDSVLTSKIPNLKDTMKKARENDGSKMDALALRLEQKILRLMDQVDVVGKKMVLEKTYSDEEDEVFDALWWDLNEAFTKFTDHCKVLGIDIYDHECLSFLSEEEGSE